MAFKSVHLALPVRNLENSIEFFEVLCNAKPFILDLGKRSCTLSYSIFEFSLFEVPNFEFFRREELGPFHIGHEVESKNDVDRLFDAANIHNYEILSEPFEREDGDYAFFVKNDTGFIFEFFYGTHALARKTNPYTDAKI